MGNTAKARVVDDAWMRRWDRIVRMVYLAAQGGLVTAMVLLLATHDEWWLPWIALSGLIGSLGTLAWMVAADYQMRRLRRSLAALDALRAATLAELHQTVLGGPDVLSGPREPAAHGDRQQS